ncbi:mannosyltransferase PIG-V [Motilibacter rhizosphaerae]|uniref:Mannosyltransferase PIG-V n=1 Tax=Motilibacter rhizosphaerae TaxID=598652 RepID=A0A4Q7NV96_9ACTN|nr:mannosyltransferase family protein [Motilibacter rhizosphaerae]RZS91176.1 mannosyltransferase PIG-V [Motilibacter rhizosphaerae]
MSSAAALGARDRLEVETDPGAPPARTVVGRALLAWLGTRLGVLIVSTVAVYGTATGGLATFSRRWSQWDWLHFQDIAEHGYVKPNDEAFFPGFPLVLKAVHAVGVPWVEAGLLVSFVAGGVAAVFLARLAELDGPRGVGERAVLVLALSPAAVFLFAGYAEALFLGLALPAWWFARRGDWWAASALAAATTGIRISGAFLAAALVVEFLTSPVGRKWRQAPFLLLPVVPLLSYAWYLDRTKGDWLAWEHAQEKGWDRHLSDPVSCFMTTWDAAFGRGQVPEFRINFRLEILMMAVGVVVTLWLLWRARWGEATFVGLSVLALGTSTWYLSVPRASLLWWPLWIGVARQTVRSTTWLLAWVVLVVPVSVVWVYLFVTGKWAG